MSSPHPLNLHERWLAPHLAYTLSKYGMSLCMLGLAAELKPHRIAVNALWSMTTIATSAVNNLLGGASLMRASRTPDIMAEAACRIFKQSASETGRFLLDETFLNECGITEFSRYSVDSSAQLQKDMFLD